VELSNVSCDYLEAMGIPLLKGRHLTDQDSSPGQPGVLINQTAARELWQGEDPIGKRFQDDPGFWYTVVGVVGDVRQWGMEREPLPEAYVPHVHGAHSFRWVSTIVVERNDPTSVVRPVKKPFERGFRLAISRIRTTEDRVSFHGEETFQRS
jgi:hypothetical protein